MGGFELTGPTKKIKYVYTSSLRCKCLGLRIDISKEQEDKFIGKTSMTLNEFHSIFDNKYTKYHVYVANSKDMSKKNYKEDPNPILNYTIKDNKKETSNSVSSTQETSRGIGSSPINLQIAKLPNLPNVIWSDSDSVYLRIPNTSSFTFRLSGPTVLINSDLKCKCNGCPSMQISKEQEDQFIGKTSMTLNEYNSIIKNYKDYHVSDYKSGENPNYVINYSLIKNIFN